MLSVLLNIALPHLQPYEFVDQQDWLKICYQSLPSREIGQYYVYGSHNQDIDIPQGLFLCRLTQQQLLAVAGASNNKRLFVSY